MIECIKAQAQGFSHKAQGKPCQDAVSVVQKKDYSIISVADGHGGERYFRSGIGSRLAVEVAQAEFEKLFLAVSRQLPGGKINWEKTLKSLESNIVKKWQDKVEEDFAAHPFSSEEHALAEKLEIDFCMAEKENCEREKICGIRFRNSEILKCYGSTLLCALYTPTLKFPNSKKSFWIALQIGDGLTFALDENGEEFLPIPDDEKLGFGVTTSICSSNAAENFRHAFGFSKLSTLVVCTDGVADSFAKEKFGAFVKDILHNMNEQGREKTQQGLQEYFPKLSEQGSGDDLSLAGIFEIKGK
ncbi:MAG: protein phosphatase 2C domain-containing protein [Bacteroides sp.]|nr:protein phosphatase 2C domain-containing protein [Prevotella sp.]MCM1407015.1 protein phosphatase 2C domain-containing protein [Treponema brennaborense]MCM1470166.1 protein phosphatase 2C domain-containing protein [Bacteroides sp.]